MKKIDMGTIHSTKIFFNIRANTNCLPPLELHCIIINYVEFVLVVVLVILRLFDCKQIDSYKYNYASYINLEFLYSSYEH